MILLKKYDMGCKMRLGELRTKTKDLDNRLIIRLVDYFNNKGMQIHDIDIDMVTENEIFFRLMEEEK